MSDPGRPARPSLAQALPYWLKLGFVSFGGPAGQIAMMHRELVERRRWISERRFLHALNYCMLLPGPEAIQLAIYIGWLLHGLAGAVAAGVLFFLPAFALLSGLAALYLAYGDLPLVLALFQGIKPAVVAVVLYAAWRIGSRALRSAPLYGIAGLAFVGIFFLDIGFPWIVLGAGLLGALGGRLAPDRFRTGGGHGGAGRGYGPALIDDDTPPPPHAHFAWSRLLAVLAAGVVLWLAALATVAGQAPLAAMAAFFTKAAFLTIGGAYAVLPYVYQGAVEQFGWLTGAQMMDGLALGETTPGPLIMVVTWVGYLGAGLAGAAVATFFTFLPSFLFILAGGPLVEASRDDIKLGAPLTAITAAVVGVIVNLAVFFARHAFWPAGSAAEPFAGAFDWTSAALAGAALVALWRYRVDVVPVIGACAAFGLLRALLAGG
ncbi:chromate efflux transporter [Parasulfuritortus cantonensis]|uniref:Chromate efflux transporter n=1 Tax=Parasulfuritortus cantonensis TaxID=2528202 RepID=A0A4R1BDY9_9PROT|nr:chromate efflux transporter [Parasulfuritortus cantonensis]TCJ15274.1 chromate efflux transporter [Parasulfuritortus cantonensis]